MNAKDAKVGKKVRCIYDQFSEDSEHPFKLSQIKLPKKGDVYIIREVDTGYTGGIGLRLQEIKNKEFAFTKGGVREPIFALSRFELV